MTARNDLPNTPATPDAPVASVDGAVQHLVEAAQKAPPPPTAAEESARRKIALLDREARAMGTDPAAALLFHEIGLLWEDPLKNPRNAAVAYQNAYRLSPMFVGNIQAARRLFGEVGNWAMVVQLIDAELLAVAEGPQRAQLFFEKAVVLEDRLSRDDEALAALQACVAERPRAVPLLVQLEAHFAERGDAGSLVAVYRLLAEALEDAELKAHYLTLAAGLLEDRLGRSDEASEALRQAFALHQADPLLLAAEVRTAEREGRIDDLFAALKAEAQRAGEGGAPTWLRLAKLYERAGRPQEAQGALEAARKACPNEPLVLSELAQIHEAQGHHQALADVLVAWVAAVTDESELVALNLRLAALYEDALKDDEAAIARYEALLSKVPGHAAALAGMGRLLHRLGRWEALVSVFDAEIAALEDPRQQAARMFKAAEILEERLGQKDAAIERYNRCLQLQPGYLPAQKALVRLYEGAGRWADLAAMYEQDLLQTADRDEMIAILFRTAALFEERLSDLDRAIESMRRVLEIAGDHLPAMRKLGALLERTGKWADLIALNEAEAALVGDTKLVLSLHHRNAEILEEHLKDRPGATAEWERLLALSPSYLPALKALGRLYAQEGRWHDLVKMYRAEAEISPSPEQAAALIHRVGELFEHRLGDENEAIASYQEVLTLAPSYFPALRALGRIYRTQGAWESLVDVLRAEAANRADPVERANALFQAAQIWEHPLGRDEMAIEGLQEVLRLVPGHAAALRGLERLYGARGEVKERVSVLERAAQSAPSSDLRVVAQLKLAYLHLDRLNDAARAAKHAEAALALDGQNLSALKLLERVRAGDRTRRAELRAKLSERVAGNAALATSLRLSAAIDREPVGSTDVPLEALREAWEANPTDGRLAFSVERALRRKGDWAGLADLLQKRAELTEDASERAPVLGRVAELALTRLADPARAKAAWSAVLEALPGHLPALHGLIAAHDAADEHVEARALRERLGEVARDEETVIDAFVEAGELAWKRGDDAEGALACFRKALERDPLEARASAAVEEILAQRGGAKELAELQEKRGEALLAKRDTVAAGAELYAAARTWLDRVGDRERASHAVDRTLAAQATHPGALELRASLWIESERYPDAAAALSLRIAQGGSAQELAALHLKLGGLYDAHLSDSTRAAAHFQTALGLNPGLIEALEGLAAIHVQARNWTAAVDCLERLCESVTVPVSLAGHLLTYAQVVDAGLGDAQRATALYRRALELAPGNEQVLLRLVELYERQGNLPELAKLLEDQAEAWGDQPKGLALRMRVAEMFDASLGQPHKAVHHLRRVVEVEPQNLAAQEGLARALMRDTTTVAMGIEQHRTVLRLEPSRLDSVHELFRTWEAQRQTDKAFCAAGVLQFFRAHNEVEGNFYQEALRRLPQDAGARLSPPDVELLMHPVLRGHPIVEVLRAIGDQLVKVHPPNFEGAGIDKRADRLKPDHAVHKAMRSVTGVLGIEALEVYQAKRIGVFLETGEPLAVCVGGDVVRKFNAREQKFLFARAALVLLNNGAVLQKLSDGELADLFGSSVRIFHPDYQLAGRGSDERAKALRKAYSRKALKALEPVAGSLRAMGTVELPRLLEAFSLSGDRAGLALCGDVAAGLGVLLREDVNGGARPETTEGVIAAVQARADLRELLGFALSDELFRVRQKMGMVV